jgi:hypothetical protein
LFSPAQVTVPAPKYLEASIPLALARPLALDIPTTAKGQGDCFVDDIIKVYLGGFPVILARISKYITGTDRRSVRVLTVTCPLTRAIV